MQHTESLTFLRFLAALTVIIFHSGLTADMNVVALLPAAFSAGEEMVDFFFVLSGFVMFMVYYDHPLTYRQFWNKRLARIIPVYLLSAVLSLTCLFIYQGYGNDNNSAVNLLLNLFLLQSWVPGSIAGYNGPSWSLSVELFFYSILPFMLSLLRRQQRNYARFMLLPALMAWGLVQWGLYSVLTHPEYPQHPALRDFVFYFPVAQLPSFLLGISAGWYWHFYVKPARNHFALPLSLFMLGLVFTALNYRSSIYQQYAQVPGLFAPLYALLIVSIAAKKSALTQLLCTPPFAMLGHASYAMYILHWPLYFLYQVWLPGHSLNPGLNFLSYLGLVIAASVVSYYCLEAPAKRLLLRGSNRNVSNKLRPEIGK